MSQCHQQSGNTKPTRHSGRINMPIEALLRELGINKNLLLPSGMTISMLHIYLAVNLVFHAKTKHVEIEFHFVRELVAQGMIKVNSCQQIIRLKTSSQCHCLIKDICSYDISYKSFYAFSLGGILDHTCK